MPKKGPREHLANQISKRKLHTVHGRLMLRARKKPKLKGDATCGRKKGGTFGGCQQADNGD